MLRALICLALSATASAFTIGVMPQRPACAATRADSPVMMPKFLKDLCVLSRTHTPSRLRGSQQRIDLQRHARRFPDMDKPDNPLGKIGELFSGLTKDEPEEKPAEEPAPEEPAPAAEE